MTIDLTSEDLVNVAGFLSCLEIAEKTLKVGLAPGAEIMCLESGDTLGYLACDPNGKPLLSSVKGL